MRKFLAAALLCGITALNGAFTFKSYEYAKAPKTIVERQIERKLERQVVIEDSKLDLTKETALNLIKATVQVRTKSGLGSGVILFSGQCKDTSKDAHYYTYILTCAHVVKDYKKVEIIRYDYLDDREIVDEISSRGTVIFSDALVDIAIIELKSNRPMKNTVELLTPDEYSAMKLDDPAYAVGCALGYPPFITRGNISCYNIPDHYDSTAGHIMISAPAIFGNSGGGAFTVNGKLLGMVRMIGGYNGGTYSNMDFIVPVWVIDQWLRANGLGFIVGEEDASIEKLHEARNREARDKTKKLLEIAPKPR